MRFREGFIIAAVVFCTHITFSQITSFPYLETFDSAQALALPSGWLTSTNKLISGDFRIEATSSAKSAPQCLLSSDAKTAQWLLSPEFDFRGRVPERLEFYERRSSTHTSGVLLDVLPNNDSLHPLLLADTMKLITASSYVKKSIILPETLRNFSSVRFRWRILGNGSGSTATYRMDDFSVSVKKTIDLEMVNVQLFPAKPTSHDQCSALVSIVNKGIDGDLTFTVVVYDDHGMDSVLVDEEILCERTVTAYLVSSGTTQISLNLGSLSPGKHRLVSCVDMNLDEDVTNNSVPSYYSISYPPRTILVNEIMYAPTAGPEWIECVNMSSDTLSCLNWRIGDSGPTRISINSSCQIPPKSLFLICKDESIRNYYDIDSIPIATVALPSLNNDRDAVVICDPTGLCSDSVAYASSMGGGNGISLERIDTGATSLAISNWRGCKDPSGATPGRANSIVRRNIDLLLDSIIVEPTVPTAHDDCTVRIHIVNRGRLTIIDPAIDLFLDRNGDSVFSSEELLGRQLGHTILPDEEQWVTFGCARFPQGWYHICATGNVAGDDDAANNSLITTVTTRIGHRSVVINEIMFAPQDDQPEWVEIYNSCDHELSLNGWIVGDGQIPGKGAVIKPRLIMAPYSYAILLSDSNNANSIAAPCPLVIVPFSSLSNTTPDVIVLCDNLGITIDSLWYHPRWGGNGGNSLQRKDYDAPAADSTNWNSAAPTPGVENTGARKDDDIGLANCSARQTGDTIDVNCTIRNCGRVVSSPYSLFLFHDVNRNNIAEPSEKICESLDLPGIRPLSQYEFHHEWNSSLPGDDVIMVSLVYQPDENLSNNNAVITLTKSYPPQVVVINEIMYDPIAGSSEYLELFNRSNHIVDLCGWRIMDAPTTSGHRNVVNLSSTKLILHPGSFVVVAGDSSVLKTYPELLHPINTQVIIADATISLGNSGDDIVLIDHTGTQIDSVYYDDTYHLPKIVTMGRSLEKINPSLPGTIRTNWSTSVAPAGGTPGRSNSVYTTILPSSASITLSPNPFSPDNDGVEDHLVISYSLPTASASIRARCYDVQGRLIRTLANKDLSGSSGALLWNGRDDSGRRVRMGPYVIFFEALDNFGTAIKTIKAVAVVAAKL